MTGWKGWMGAALLCAMSASPAAAEEARSSGIAIVGADVLQMTRAGQRARQTVLAAGDRSTRIGPQARARVPEGCRRVDGPGLGLLPCHVDLHVHLANEPTCPGDAAQRALAVMLADGMTTARGMAGGTLHPALQEVIARGEVVGPRLYAALPPLNEQIVGSPEAARTAVLAAEAAGHDLFRAHDLEDAAIWSAARDATHSAGLRMAGHVTNPVGLGQAIADGRPVEHLDGAFQAVLPAHAPERAIRFAPIPPAAVVRAAAARDQTHLDALARKPRAAQGHQVPAPAPFEKIVDVDRPIADAAADPTMRYVLEAAPRAWRQQHRQLKAAGLTQANGQRFIALRGKIVCADARAGVPIMAGSDTALASHLGGAGLLEQLGDPVRAGLTPVAALSTAPLGAMRVFVLRHLATQNGPDPALTPAGTRQAAALAAQLKGAGITSIHVTATRRSRETVAPLAAALGLEPRVYDPRNPGALVAEVASSNGGALVVGHSNTVPDLITRFGGTSPPPLGHSDFGDLWVVEPGGATRRLEAGGAPIEAKLLRAPSRSGSGGRPNQLREESP